VGEYLVAAEVCRRGLIATTFTGNVPHYRRGARGAAERERWAEKSIAFTEETLP
jgi:hypothetical protein